MVQSSNSISTVVAQVDGDHYDQDDFARCPHCGRKVQHWDLFGMAPYLIGNATKYLARLGRKSGERELTACDKAISYIEKYMRVIEAKLTREKLELANNAIPEPLPKRRNQFK